MIRYPAARWLGNGGPNRDGRGYGPLPDTARGASVDQVRVVAHTLEVESLPDYNGVDPHLTYLPTAPAGSRWFQHVDFDRRCGTLVGRSTTGVLGNEFSVQFEIGAYSDKGLADKRGHLWVGDFADEHYSDVASFIRWAREHLFWPHLTLLRAYGPSVDFDSFAYGVGDRHEMSKPDWLGAGGILTAHGAGPGQSHWDTGVLDLHRIIRESLDQVDPAPGPVVLRRGDRGPQVTAAQERLLVHGLELPKFGADGDFGQETETAVAAARARFGLDPTPVIDAALWERLNADPAPPPPSPAIDDYDVIRGHLTVTLELLGDARARVAAALERIS